MAKINDRKISNRNYIIVAIVSIITIIIPLYVSTIYLNNMNDLLNKSIFEEDDSKVSQINFSDIDFVVSESNNVVLYVSYYSNNIRSMERKLYREIVRNDLSDSIIYLNVSEVKDYVKKLQDKFPDIKGEISDAPLMIYIKDGEAICAVNSEYKMVDYDVFKKLIDKYGNKEIE